VSEIGNMNKSKPGLDQNGEGVLVAKMKVHRPKEERF
jgi:hypothetical protein